jgi:thioesterase domain-containing protein
VPVRRAGDRPPFVCVAAGDADLFALSQLASLLGPDRPYYLLKPPAALRGLLRRPWQAPQHRGELIATYASHVRAVAGGGPCHLGGYSCGGLAALEVAQDLRRQGVPVGFVGLLDAPFRVSTLACAAQQLVRRFGGESLRHPRRPARIPTRALRHLLGFLTDEGLALHLHLLRGYVPGPYAGRLTLFVPEGPAIARPFQHVRSWQRVAGGRLDVDVVPGDHTSFVRVAHARVLAQRLAARLDAAEAARQRYHGGGRD